MSIYLRDQLILECWTPAHLRQPETSAHGPHYPVQVWGVIEDPNYKLGDLVRYADVVAWWPALKLWTCTSQNRADEEVNDVKVRVVLWQPLPPVPETWP